MLLIELFPDEIDEGKFVNTVGALGVGALAALGGYGAIQDGPKQPPSITSPNVPSTQVQQPPQQSPNTRPMTVRALTNQQEREQILIDVAFNAGITGTELAQFMAQARHETGNFENLRERSGGDRNYFNKYDPQFSPNTAKILGNTERGDGKKFRGRGFLQITGRDNYNRVGRGIDIDLIKNPEKLEEPLVAARAAIWFWQHRVSSSIEDFENTSNVTRRINPARRGLENRQSYYNDYAANLIPTR
jgi:putative chitinase